VTPLRDSQFNPALPEAELNPNSLEVLTDCKLEPALRKVVPFERYHFERPGDFCVDPETLPGELVFNRTAALRDTWAKVEKQSGK
jgi:glutaminyl-tRNA synthetase